MLRATRAHPSLTLLALSLVAGCGVSNSERPYPAEAGAGGAPAPVSSPGSGGAAGGLGAGGAPAPMVVADAASPAADVSPPDGSAGEVGAGERPAASGCQPAPVPACDLAPPTGVRRAWANAGTRLLVIGGARHRGRDLFVTDGPQWLIARFAYGLVDAPLVGEEVDIHLLRGCAGAWEQLGTVRTSRSGEHPEVEGVADDGGRIFFQVPAERALGSGRHRVRFVVAGDLTSAELFVEVVPRGMPLFVADIDGTLTTSETAEFGALFTGATPEANPDAAAVLSLLAAKGHRPFYLTARPEWLVPRSREFLASRGFPPGLLHTTLGGTGAVGGAAAMFKTGELERLANKGLRPRFAFGNTDTDAQAYAGAGIQPPTGRIFYRYTDGMHGGRRIESYAELMPELQALAPACP